MAILEHYEAAGFVETWGFRFSKHLIYKEDAERPDVCKVLLEGVVYRDEE